MIYLVICTTAFLASGLTFFSGFGLGTLLLPAFAVFFPVELAVAMTAVVHFANGLFKVVLVGRHAAKAVVLRFGLPAMVAAFGGAWTLGVLADLPPWFDYELAGRTVVVTPVKFVIGLLLVAFALIESLPALREKSFDARWLPFGGMLSGFFGGLSGNQGALRSAFLVRAGLSKEAFIGSGVVIACLIDLSRLGLYSRQWMRAQEPFDYGLLGVAMAAAFVGALIGNRYLKKLTMRGLQRLVGAMLFLVGIGLAGGIL
ncbi:MAG: sulfite exporter TauE/SafE family protein [Verrucomicrobia bacterium]|nr:sulfite exporter TauE/SafE family protein [Verrucomicrobiota bacterium]